ncbi:hypothetical protein J437_LFUL012584, partial [Ladona fulva]
MWVDRTVKFSVSALVSINERSSKTSTLSPQFCTHRETSDKRRYPTFARTRPPDTQISKSVTTLLLHFNWTQVAFLHQISLEGEFSAVASTISAAMQASGISVRVEKTWNGPFYLGYMDNPFCKILEETRENAR